MDRYAHKLYKEISLISLIKMDTAILTESGVINTYPVKNQKLAATYLEYIKLKQQNPGLGYKKLSKLLKEPLHRTRYWHHNNAVPQPILTIDWLKNKGLLSLGPNNPNSLLITKVFGALFGDGGIFGNLNGIFLSSSELTAVKEFGEDLKILFGEEIEKNSRIIEGGVYGHSWCYQNTNRNIIRFFMALGAPIGDKSLIEMIVPKWILNAEEYIQDEFFGSLFGAELGVPKVHIEGNRLDLLSFGITAKDELGKNRIAFLDTISDYLKNKGIRMCKININDHRKVNRQGDATKVYRLIIAIDFENVTNFMTLTKMNYCTYKKQKLANTMNEFSRIKMHKFNDLITRGYSEDAALTLLKLTPASLEIIENFEDFREIL